MTRIKCCGVTRVQDALLAARLGVDAVGLVFTRHSKRYLSISDAMPIRQVLPPFVSCVALFMDDDQVLVDAVVAAIRPDLLQFHGSETNTWCTRFNVPWIKAIGLGGSADGLTSLSDYPDASGLLLDGHDVGKAGGSGKALDWTSLPENMTQPMILAGGLHADNVGAAIRLTRPWAVDVSSGVEASPGVKDLSKLNAFIRAVHAA